MSRSYQKHPHCSDGDGARKFFKKYANKKVRKHNPEETLPTGSSYKRVFESYGIVDRTFDCCWEEFVKWEWVKSLPYEEQVKEWKRFYWSK